MDSTRERAAAPTLFPATDRVPSRPQAPSLEAAGPESAAAAVVVELRELSEQGDLDLPEPGTGETVARWSALAGWGRRDLALARLAEGHTDACAILSELGSKPRPGALYGVWAARSGGTGAHLVDSPGGPRVAGTVRFCSGAHGLDRALVVALGPAGAQIVDLDLADARITPVAGSWRSAGMVGSDSADVVFDDVPVPTDALIGPVGSYLDRPGFWWGGGGVAAVWLGGALGVLDHAHELLPADPDPHSLAHLGTLHTDLAATDALLARTATAIDADPAADHRLAVWLARSAAEATARAVLDLAPRLVGAAALSREERLAQQLADLGVFIRQHHGERDLAQLGSAMLAGVRAESPR